VSEVCSRAVILYCGQVMEEAHVGPLFREPLHPYTQGLLKSLPSIGRREKLYVIRGTVPSPRDFPSGCVFHPRCERATERCREAVPELKALEGGRRVRCWLY